MYVLVTWGESDAGKAAVCPAIPVGVSLLQIQ